jgi:hypothetical protein
MRQALKNQLSANGKKKRVLGIIMPTMIAPSRSKLIDFIQLMMVLAVTQRHRRAFLNPNPALARASGSSLQQIKAWPGASHLSDGCARPWQV